MLPDPALSLAFTCFRDPSGRPTEPRLLIVGPVTRPRAFALEAGFEMAAVKLKLEWVEPVLDLAPADYADALEDAPVLPEFGTDPVHEALRATRSAEHAVEVLAVALARRTGRRAGHTLATRRAMDLARVSAGRLPVERLAHLTSARQLRRVVRRETGTTLRAFTRTVRLLHVVTAADRTPRPAWARLAADAGYCDQSHLVRDCRSLCGLSPDRLFRERCAEAEMSNRG